MPYLDITLQAGDTPQSVNLSLGFVLIVTGDSLATGKVERIDPIVGGVSVAETISPVKSGAVTVGPYQTPQQFLITCTAGSIAVKNTDIALASPTIKGNSNSFANQNGRLIQADGLSGALNFDQSKLRKWCAAKARVLSKTGRAVIAYVGDSRITGFGATGSASFIGARAKNRGAQLAAYLNSKGIPAHTDNFFCDGNVNSGSITANQYDPRIVTGAGWVNTGAYDVVQWTGCGKAFSNLTTTNPMSFTPDNLTDTADIYYLTRAGFGTIDVSVAGSVVATLNENVAQSIKKLTITYPRGAQTITFTPVTLGTGVFIYGCDCYDSTTPKVSVWTFGNSGAGVSDLTFNSFPWEGTQPFKLGIMQPDVSILDIGVNDANNQTTIANYTTRLSTIVDNLQTSGGNCFVCTFVAASLTSWPRAAQPLVQSFYDAITGIAINKAIPIIDHATRFVSYEVSNPLGFFADTLHQNGVAMSDQANIDGSVLMSA